jgi:putative peptidoglycan lipid II flippase
MEEPQPPSIDTEQVQVAQAASILALGSISSRVMGLIRVVVKSNLFGAGPHVSALDAAVRVPNTLYDLLVGGMVSSAIVPVLSDYAAPERRDELWRLLSSLIVAASLIVSGLLLLGELFAPQVIYLMAGGMTPAAQELSAELLRLVLPTILFLNLSGILMGALYALKRFALPAFTATIFNAAVVVVALALGRRWSVHSMALGLVLGAILQVLLQLPGLRDARFRIHLNLHHPALRRIMSLYSPIMIGLLVDMLAVALSYNLASRIDDSAISWMEFAAQIIQLPLGLVAMAISVATLPTLSRQASADDGGAFKTTLSQGLRMVLTLIVPASVGLFVLANPIIGLVLEHGDFTPQDTVAVAEALRYHLPGLIFAAVDQLLIFAFYARKDTLTPALVGVWANIAYAVTALVLQWAGALTLPLLILINSFKWAVHAVTMLLLARRHLDGLGKLGLWSLTLKAVVASLIMAPVTFGVGSILAGVVSPGLRGELLIVFAAGCAGLVAYVLSALVLRIEEVNILRAVGSIALARLTGRQPQAIIRPPEETEQQ